jgi:hypothetical protein
MSQDFVILDCYILSDLRIVRSDKWLDQWYIPTVEGLSHRYAHRYATDPAQALPTVVYCGEGLRPCLNDVAVSASKDAGSSCQPAAQA